MSDVGKQEQYDNMGYWNKPYMDKTRKSIEDLIRPNNIWNDWGKYGWTKDHWVTSCLSIWETASYPMLWHSEEASVLIIWNRSTTHYIPYSKRTGRTTGCAMSEVGISLPLSLLQSTPADKNMDKLTKICQ